MINPLPSRLPPPHPGEADRPWFTTDESHDVDHVMTTAELATIFQERGIDLPVRKGVRWQGRVSINSFMTAMNCV